VTAKPQKNRVLMVMRRDLWMQDEGLTVLLGAVLVRIFLVSPLAAAGVFRGYTSLVINLWLALTLLSGIFAIGWRRKTARVIATLALVLFVLRGLGLAGGRGAVGLSVDAALTIFLLSMLVLMVVWQILREGPITRQRVQGSIIIYLLLGWIFAEAYALAANLDPNSFAGNLGTGTNAVSARWTYFSFVTLTTVGYGDITPNTLVTRPLANIEALIGQLYPAILIARLVSMEITARQTKNTEG